MKKHIRREFRSIDGVDEEYIVFESKENYLDKKKYRVINEEEAYEILATTRDFSNCYFDDVDLSDKDISGVNFENSYLVDCYLPNDLRNLNFKDADFSGEDYNYEELYKVMAGENGGFSNKDFRGSNLSGANFAGLSLKKSDFREANITAISFTATDLTECNFENIKTRSTSFTQAKAIKANF